ncbi:hypothetical protein EI94DRAFT_1699326 [Lactarius quietus]|nr:hypothetical protein EI94DRAFT_1699326 [Lactarius quietus]
MSSERVAFGPESVQTLALKLRELGELTTTKLHIAVNVVMVRYQDSYKEIQAPDPSPRRDSDKRAPYYHYGTTATLFVPRILFFRFVPPHRARGLFDDQSKLRQIRLDTAPWVKSHAISVTKSKQHHLTDCQMLGRITIGTLMDIFKGVMRH